MNSLTCNVGRIVSQASCPGRTVLLLNFLVNRSNALILAVGAYGADVVAKNVFRIVGALADHAHSMAGWEWQRWSAISSSAGLVAEQSKDLLSSKLTLGNVFIRTERTIQHVAATD